MPRIELIPGGRVVEASPGAPLRDVLFGEGIEFPCGGTGQCGRCKVRVVRGVWPVSDSDARRLSPGALEEGWRLSCRGVPQGPLTLEVGQWEAPILVDESAFAFTPCEGLGIAIDLGTTTVAAQLIDRRSAQILAVATGFNAQGVFGADIMSRLDFAQRGGGPKLTQIIRDQVYRLVQELIAKSGSSHEEIRLITIVGNTAMHHLFCGLSVERLAQHPFEPETLEAHEFSAHKLGWSPLNVQVLFVPPIGGFVGSDILAGIIATHLDEDKRPVALIDLGTNGEIVIACDGRLVCASTAAGPAFEGARISAGMRATTGAISAVHIDGSNLIVQVIGGGKAQGICGSGLVDAIATGLDTGIVEGSGRFQSGRTAWELADGVTLQQRDVRELQLAKAAIAAGLLILLEEVGCPAEALECLYLAGAFGNYINRESAFRVGLIPIVPDKVVAAGNTALLGAKLSLFSESRQRAREICPRIEHISLNERPDFQDVFLEQLAFPANGSGHAKIFRDAYETG